MKLWVEIRSFLFDKVFKNKNPEWLRDFFIRKLIIINYLINSIFCASSALMLSKKPCSFIHSSLNTLLIYLEP